jgi:hypothetical protein
MFGVSLMPWTKARNGKKRKKKCKKNQYVIAGAKYKEARVHGVTSDRYFNRSRFKH